MYIYLLYLTPYGSNEPHYFKVGYTSQLGGVIDNYKERTNNYHLSMGYHWELPSTSTQQQARAIKQLLAVEVGSLSPEDTLKITGQRTDLYQIQEYERVLDVLHEIVSNYGFDEIVQSREIKRTKSNDTKSLQDELPREEQLRSKVSRWISNKTVEKLQQLLPAFKSNNKEYTSDEIETTIIEIILGKKI